MVLTVVYLCLFLALCYYFRFDLGYKHSSSTSNPWSSRFQKSISVKTTFKGKNKNYIYSLFNALGTNESLKGLAVVKSFTFYDRPIHT